MWSYVELQIHLAFLTCDLTEYSDDVAQTHFLEISKYLQNENKSV